MCASYELYTETKLRIGKLDGRVDRGTSVASGVRAHQRAGDGAPLAVSRMGTNASTINFCAEPITWTRRTASQEVVDMEAVLLDEQPSAGSGVLALVVSGLLALSLSTLTDAGCSFSGARRSLSDYRIASGSSRRTAIDALASVRVR